MPADYRGQLRDTCRRDLDRPADHYGLRFGRTCRAVKDDSGTPPAPMRKPPQLQYLYREMHGGLG